MCFSWRNKPPPPPPLTNQWVKLAASGPLLRSPCSQAARLPVPDGGDSRPPAPTPLSHCDRMCRVFAQELVCLTVNLRRVRLPFPTRSLVCSPFLLRSCLHVCVSLKIDLVLFVTGLHVSRVSQFEFEFTVECKTQGPRAKRRRNGSQAAASDHIMSVAVLFRPRPDGSLSLSLLTSWIYRCVGDVRAANTLLSIPALTAA